MKKGFKSAWSSLKNSKTGMFGLILVLLIIICAIFAPLLAPYDPLAQDVMIKLKDPIWGADPVAGHLLGTDQLGRDILSRLLYGARVTLIVALAGTVVGGIVGVVLGSLAGYYGKWVDAVIMRLVDIQLCFPFTLLALFIAAVLGGIGSIGGAVIGAFLLGFIEIMLVLFLPGLSGYKDAFAFVLLIIILLVKPTGLLGDKAGIDKA